MHNNTHSRFQAQGWRAAGFSGFQPLLQLDASTVPVGGGVYAVLRTTAGPPTFTAQSSGGHFKGKDPRVDVDDLTRKWVSEVETVYIGKATSLRKRLIQYRDFGRGRPIGHWGGRYIWQLKDAAGLVVCWSVTLDEPRIAESSLLNEFFAIYGRRPFANLVD